ncbi:hypothetical protein MSAN_02327500 [Mycena sanguinolenta]|uniref:Uncharacterized protein n=1 Tax=Mycena sanguinolenta TaxID=230812 RepID=A0A8H7CFM5_9AGAR|nr:hypothetical protein MSAN_02327500 [Mycena sanguinolenta]
MWADYRENGAEFSAGDDLETPEARHGQLREEARCFGLWNPVAMAKRLGFGDEEVANAVGEDEEDDYLGEVMRNADARMSHRLTASGKYRRSFGLNVAFQAFPADQFKATYFFMNDPRAIIAKDWTNPTTRKLIHVYREIPEDGVIREFWHAQEWRKTMDLDILSPMYAAGPKHYYINEVSQLRDGNFAVPIRWVTFHGKVYADAFAVTFNAQKEAIIVDTKTIFICAEDLIENYYDLEHAGKIPKWATSTKKAGYPECMPNPKRIIAAGRPMYSSFVNYFSDDVSGNRSKSWNKHWNAYMTHGNLPRELHQQEFHVHFVSTSPNATVSEQFQEFKIAVEATHTAPVEVQDEFGNASCFCLYVNAGASDNPMQSEVASHIGGKGNYLCRKCQVGGTQKEKTSNEGYHSLFEGGVPRTKEQILKELEKQVNLACSGVAKHVADSQTQTGVKDVYTQFWIEQLRKEQPERTKQDIQEELIQWTVENHDKIYSPFLTMKGFDPVKDTPIEILHTILLGVIKYIWHVTHTAWSPEEKQTFAVRLQATNTDALSIHAIRSAYIMQYAGSLIGRQFKTITQTNIFHVRGLVADLKFKAWRAVGELSALLWVPEIRSPAEYQGDLKVAIGNVLDICASIDPSKIRILVLIGVATEIFESFNGVFRYCSILSNHLAPSRDIARQLGDQEGLKHRITGGWWSSDEGRKWVQAGSGVRRFMLEHPVLQKLIGWTEKKSVKHGEIRLVPLKRGQTKREDIPLKSTSAARALNFGLYNPDSVWKRCLHVISESLDECFIDSWVFAQSPTQNFSKITGRISDILVDTAGVVLVVLEQFQVLSERDELYGMPVLVRRDGEVTFSIVPAKYVMFKFNVQHDCDSANCEATGTENFIIYKPLDRFIINTHAFHNAHLLRATLPRDLIAPIPLYIDREATHHELAAQLRQQLATKKRKRAQQDGDDDGGRRLRKSAKKSKRGSRTSGQIPQESLAAGKGKRQIKRTEKARATPEPDSDEVDSETESDSSDMAYEDESDDNCSD